MARSDDPAADASWRSSYAMAIAFGLLAVPWTLGFDQVVGLPLWPSFVASASFFAAGGGGRGLVRSLSNNALGAVYAAATLASVAAAGLGVVGLSLLVGLGMFVASLHALVPVLSFTPAAFLGYAATFGVHAAGTTLAWPGLAGELSATLASMAIGAGLGLVSQTAARGAG